MLITALEICRQTAEKFLLKVRNWLVNFVLSKVSFFLKTFPWTQGMQFWRPCQKFPRYGQKIAHYPKMIWKSFFFKIKFCLKKFLLTRRKQFVQLRRIFCKNWTKKIAHSPKMIKKALTKNLFFVKQFLFTVKCNLDKRVKKIRQKTKFFVGSQLIKKTFFSCKKVFFFKRFIQRRLEFWPPPPTFFGKLAQNFLAQFVEMIRE